MSRNQYAYIVEKSQLTTDFDTPIDGETKPSGLINIDFIEDEEENAKKASGEVLFPQWLNRSRYKNC